MPNNTNAKKQESNQKNSPQLNSIKGKGLNL